METTWRLEKLRIDFHKWWSFNKSVDKYTWSVVFTNEKEESFDVKIDEEMTKIMLKLLSWTIVDRAQKLREDIWRSLELIK
jgi:hypothetical protein